MLVGYTESVKQKPLPPSIQLAPTLARRVLQLREFRNLTVVDLARLCRFTPERIEDIESGLETWFSATDRQILAKALSVEPAMLQEVEQRAVKKEDADNLESLMRELEAAILGGARDLACPRCSYTLKCSVQDGYDLEGMPMQLAKAFCTRCPFVLR